MTTPRPKGILFDKDGTLIDFRATWVPAYRGVADELAGRLGGGERLAAAMLGRLGYDVRSGDFAADSLLLWETNEAIAAAWYVTPEIAGRVDVLEVVLRHFSDVERYPPRPVGDLSALLGRLRKRGLLLGVATMDDTAIAHAHLRHLGIADRLDFIVGADAGHGAKPAPGMVQAFCTAVGLEPAEVIVVGDTPADLLMARNAGCAQAIAVLTGAMPADVLLPHADKVLPSVQELEVHLGLAEPVS
ncbi:MAG: HAD family hydrolase [Geminicoccaceae bacterium]